MMPLHNIVMNIQKMLYFKLLQHYKNLSINTRFLTFPTSISPCRLGETVLQTIMKCNHSFSDHSCPTDFHISISHLKFCLTLNQLLHMSTLESFSGSSRPTCRNQNLLLSFLKSTNFCVFPFSVTGTTIHYFPILSYSILYSQLITTPVNSMSLIVPNAIFVYQPLLKLQGSSSHLSSPVLRDALLTDLPTSVLPFHLFP